MADSDLGLKVQLVAGAVQKGRPPLRSLPDVDVESPSDGDTLIYDGASGRWKKGAPGGGLTGFTASLDTASPNDIINASELAASGGTSSQDFVIAPAGQGALLATLPTGDGVGGNKRGINATDLQILSSGKNSATQVASGQRAAILGGSNNTASNFYSTVVAGQSNTASGAVSFVGGGVTNTASGDYSAVGGGLGNVASGNASTVGGGSSNAASGSYSAVGGGANNTASGIHSYVPGGAYADTRGILGYGAVASANFGVDGDAQLGVLPLSVQTADATPTVLTSDQGAPGTSNQVVLPDNSSFGFHGNVVGRVPSAGTSSYWEFKGLIERGAGAASTVIVGSVTPSLISQDADASTWSIAVTADTTNGALQITVTGEDATTINWLSRIETEELVA